MTKELNGRELSLYIKERQAKEVRRLKAERRAPKLVIIRDNDAAVIEKYVNLKKRYGEDIGVEVIDRVCESAKELKEKICEANEDKSVAGIIVQLPLKDKEMTDEVVAGIAPEKDVDGLSGKGKFDSATATAINWLLGGYNIELEGKKIALVGRGRLVGAPLLTMFKNSGYDVTVFRSKDSLEPLNNYDVIITATGVPHLIKNKHVKPGAVVVDAGTASEDGVIVGDVDEEVRGREDLGAITPKIGGVGPMTVTLLFENVIRAAGLVK
ncbi:bifunctional 5,10-methylenetetrahydrofolate dehydrogenase/5,10-methenyltetrahydrofolate cyclohydrolase [Candidatus Saccharibacteria bacterium]|nr:bifunctional 5,10-methylenetetrahydrofolate dehydrogenase/5,10-methenyltetrahydrofolate cyclohydrolase [Candidatus Saccharibacteria bacterium]